MSAFRSDAGPEQSAGPSDQNEDHEAKGERVAQRRFKICDAHHLHDAEDQAARHRPVDAAEPADQHDRHALDTHVEAHEWRDGVEIETDEDACDAAQRGRYAEGHQNHRIDIDTEYACDV